MAEGPGEAPYFSATLFHKRTTHYSKLRRSSRPALPSVVMSMDLRCSNFMESKLSVPSAYRQNILCFCSGILHGYGVGSCSAT